jgi:subtilase family serine protease
MPSTFRNILLFSVFFLSILLFLTIASHAQSPESGSATRRLITQPIDESKLVTLGGNTRPEAITANDRGPVDDSLPMEHMLLQLQRPPELEQALEIFIDQLHDPNSQNFRRWLTADEFGKRFGLAQVDLAKITPWLESHGFRINVVYPSRTVIDFSGTAGQVKETFHSEIHFVVATNGVMHFANMSDPRIPAAFSPAVRGIVSLHNFLPHPMHEPRANFTFSGGSFFGVVPADLAKIYNFNPLFNAGNSGQGQTIVAIEDTDVYTTSDWTTFRSTFGLSSYTSGTLTQVHPAPPSGSNNCTDPGVVAGRDDEAILDAEYSSAAAPSAAIQLAACKDTSTFGGLIALQNLLNESTSPPAIVSVSYGECEPSLGATANAAFSAAYQQAVTEGVSVFVAAGDSGAAVCDADEPFAQHGIAVSGFASTPYNVAVGGTDFEDTFLRENSTYWSSTNGPTYGSALSYIPEIPWNDSCGSELFAIFDYQGIPTYGSNGVCNTHGLGQSFSGSGGPSGCATGTPSTSGVVSGTCKGYSKPTWQSVLGNSSDGVRDLPDVSLFSSNGSWDHVYIFCWSDVAGGGAACTGSPSGWSQAGGTSFASPIMAGIQALVNQQTSTPRWGNPNYLYYQAAASEYGSSGDSSCNSSLGNQASSSCVFYDVTVGDTDLACTGTHNCYLPSGTYGVLSTSDSSYAIAYGAGTGWDFATGIGSVNAANLASFADTSSTRPAAFSYTGSLNTARDGDTATRLNNGMVLFAGGAGNNGGLSSAELYNPSTGSFTFTTGSLAEPWPGATATLLGSGTVLIAAGLEGGTITAEVYNPSTETFAATGNLNTSREDTTATLLNNGMVLIAGGYDGVNDVALASAELYNPATGTFAYTGSLNDARFQHTATLLNSGMVLITGGSNGSGFVTQAELYNPTTGKFTVTGTLSARLYPTATLLNNGMVLIAGGIHGSNYTGYLSTADLYNPTTGTFTATGSLNTARDNHTATLLSNGMVLIAGGIGTCGSSCFEALSSAELYNPTTGTFTVTASLNTARDLPTATLLNNGMVLIAGGASIGGSGFEALSSAELYRY